MLYLANASSPAIRDAMTAGELGQMCTPAEGRTPLPRVAWAADNGCFSAKGFPGEDKWVAWLERHRPHADRALFAVAPDVWPDAPATLERSAPWFPVIRRLGYPAALVAQNGQEDLPVPWDDIDCLFLGGTTEWKIGHAAADLARQAKDRGKWVHMGRVNSGKRWRIATNVLCDSCDGTFLAFAPDTNLARFRAWPR